MAIAFAALATGTFGAGVFLLASQLAQRRPLIPALLHVPLLMALGIGMSLVNTRAIVGALLRRESPFIRTPKAGDGHRTAPDPARSSRRIPDGTIELAIAIGLVPIIVLCVGGGATIIGVPFLVLFAIGFLGVGTAALHHQDRESADAPSPVSMPVPRLESEDGPEPESRTTATSEHGSALETLPAPRLEPEAITGPASRPVTGG
jgi:hypothetical protein